MCVALIACVQKTSDGRVIRHRCVEGHWTPITSVICNGKFGCIPYTSEMYVCDREHIDTLPLGERE